MNKVLKKFGIALCVALVAGAALAFPDKPVRIIVPYPAGGATDVSARIVAERLGAAWGQSIVVENKPGAAGAIGTDLVAKSPADGYTVLLQVPIMIATELTRPASTSYRTLRDFVPVSTVFTVPVVYLASAAAPEGGLKEILTAARTRPGELDYGHHGEGSSSNYLGAKLKKAAGVEMVGVPYNGDGPILTDLLGGHLKTGFLSGMNAKKAAESGRARMLAITGVERSPLLPSVPTFAEQGLEGLDRGSWGKLFMPAGTPQPIIEQMARDVTRIVRSPDVQERFTALGLVGVGGTPSETLRDVQAEYAYWTRQIKEFGFLAKQ